MIESGREREGRREGEKERACGDSVELVERVERAVCRSYRSAEI